MAEFLIEIRDQEVGIVIGLHEFETHAPQRVLVSVQVLTEEVSGTAQNFVDYDAIAAHIRSLAGTRVETQEDLIRGIHAFVLRLPGVAAARVSSKKPDIFADCDWVGLTYPARPLFGG